MTADTPVELIEIGDAQIPLGAGEAPIEILEPQIPLAAGVPAMAQQGSAWSLLNLIMSAIGGLAAIALTIRAIVLKKAKKREDEVKAVEVSIDEDGKTSTVTAEQMNADAVLIFDGSKEGEQPNNKDKKRKISWLTVANVLAASAIVLFILTQDVTQPMAWMDMWTFVHAAILGVEAFAIVHIIQKKRNPDDKGGTKTNNALPAQA